MFRCPVRSEAVAPVRLRWLLFPILAPLAILWVVALVLSVVLVAMPLCAIDPATGDAYLDWLQDALMFEAGPWVALRD